jgi:NhaP-type Na+/H+ or K+/H+ antiporter
MIFILIGLELKEVIGGLDNHSIALYCFYAFIITIVAIIIRAWRIFTFKKSLEKGFANPRLKDRRRISENNLISAQESIIISLSGMRGIVSLAIALALPLTMKDGTPFPMREEILFITFMVILYSVIGQGLLLPFVIKRLNKQA